MKKGEKARAGVSGRAARILAVLARRGGPMTAYQMLAALSGEGVRSPMVIYRALRSLERDGLVHRVESLNAWVAAAGCGEAGRPVIAICEDCGSVEMLPGRDAAANLAGLARAVGFSATAASIELFGRCGSCREQRR